MTDTAVEEMSFEQAMAELEQVLGQLERGDVELDQSIALYERGAKAQGSRGKSGGNYAGRGRCGQGSETC